MWLLFLYSFKMWLWAILFCNNYNELVIHVIFRLDVTFVVQRTPWPWIDDEVFLVILETRIPSNFRFYSNHKWNWSHVIFRLDVKFVIQRTPWLRIDDEVFLVILKTRVPSDFCFYSNHNEIGVMSYLVLMWHLS